MQRLATLFFMGGATVLLSFTVPATEKPVKATTHATARAAVIYQVDSQQSKLSWLAKKVTGSHNGHIGISAGQLELDNNVLKGGSFTIDTRSLTVTDITNEASNARLTGHLKSDDFFSVEKHPTAQFVITSAAGKGGANYDVTGKLTIKGITNSISFPAEVTVAGGKATAKASIKVDRTKFDIKYRSSNFFENLGDKAIYDDFTIDVVLVANAK
ncbi:lipid-binding protein [Chitinophaga alhagiae]|uniref:Lipid-binding protein n=1 Tax=Chitinophaga alhagiae TaxID=2203219 RepID=A0ABN5LPW6_9BACT|nr:YceI family protein [Chitinophaga alhagiae]AWO00218.1 lipid-binding protein [Chitinophaga alhagiae]